MKRCKLDCAMSSGVGCQTNSPPNWNSLTGRLCVVQRTWASSGLGSARVSRVVSASSLKRSFLVISIQREVRDGATPSLRQLPDETRALPGVAHVEIIGKLQFHFHEDNTRSSTRRLRLCAAV